MANWPPYPVPAPARKCKECDAELSQICGCQDCRDGFCGSCAAKRRLSLAKPEPIRRSIPERRREYGPPNPALDLSDHLELNEAGGVEVWRLREMLEGVLKKLPASAVIVGFQLGLAIDHEAEEIVKTPCSFGEEPEVRNSPPIRFQELNQQKRLRRTIQDCLRLQGFSPMGGSAPVRVFPNPRPVIRATIRRLKSLGSCFFRAQYSQLYRRATFSLSVSARILLSQAFRPRATEGKVKGRSERSERSPVGVALTPSKVPKAHRTTE